MKNLCRLFFLCSLLQSSFSFAQGADSGTHGFLSLGVRNSVGFFFSEGKIYAGTSAGGQLGLHLSDRVNSHWFGDYITTDFDGRAQRIDVHGGFSVMPVFPLRRENLSRISVFPLAGFCIDYTKISLANSERLPGEPAFGERYSFATQFGAGTCFRISERMDLSLETHYMLHIGTDIDVELRDQQAMIIRRTGANLEGHLLFAISMDYKLFRLWGRN